jgi:hypothetical protein
MEILIKYYKYKYKLLLELRMDTLLSLLHDESSVQNILPYEPYSDQDIEYTETRLESNIEPPRSDKYHKRTQRIQKSYKYVNK